ncbi:hypothetical protein M0805_003016 [Coniferiporia weirii]|nr:hypothetical protein M0805_003016 [Coniferiporia weirii]
MILPVKLAFSTRSMYRSGWSLVNNRLSVELVEENNVRKWRGVILGRDGTPYEGGHFKFDVELPEQYPFQSPEFKFTTRIYHPGINEKGEVCLAMFRDWKPAITLLSVFEAILDKLDNPKVDDPFVPEIAQQLKDDPGAFNATAREWTEKHAKHV